MIGNNFDLKTKVLRGEPLIRVNYGQKDLDWSSWEHGEDRQSASTNNVVVSQYAQQNLWKKQPAAKSTTKI